MSSKPVSQTRHAQLLKVLPEGSSESSTNFGATNFYSEPVGVHKNYGQYRPQHCNDYGSTNDQQDFPQGSNFRNNQVLNGQDSQAHGMTQTYPAPRTQIPGYQYQPVGPNAFMPTGQRQQHYVSSAQNAYDSGGDTDKRSHEHMDSCHCEQPPHTKIPVAQTRSTLSHDKMSHGAREEPTLDSFAVQQQTGLINAVFVPNPKGQPSQATLTPVVEGESDTSSMQDHFPVSARRPSLRLDSVTGPPKFSKLNERVELPADCPVHKVAVCGAKDVGKTSLIDCCLENSIHNIKNLDQQAKHQGVSVLLRSNMEIEKVLRLNIQEAGGIRDMTQDKIEMYKHCELVVIVFDLSNHATLREAKACILKLKEAVTTNTEILLVGNKDDKLAFNDHETSKKGQRLATEMRAYYLEVSAKEGRYTNDLLDNMAGLARDHSKKSETNASISELANMLRKSEDDRRDFERRVEESQRQIQDDRRDFERRVEESQRQTQAQFDEYRREIQELRNRRCVVL